MAAADVLPPSLDKEPTFTPIYDLPSPPVTAAAAATTSGGMGKAAQPAAGDFDAGKHLAYRPPARKWTMKEIGMPEDVGISPVAVSEPFPLFTQEAIMRMRQEVLSKKVFENCQFSSNLAHCQLRGFASKYAPFVYDAWKDPETLRIISEVAGVDLVTQMDLEIGHINLSVKSAEEKDREVSEFLDKGGEAALDDDDMPVVAWHTDSYPFVCVTMLSDCTDMIGGETALRTGTGEILKVRGPQMGCAVVLQGKYIEHQALRALGTTERITMVTSFRPRSPAMRDDTVLTTVRAISPLAELYGQFAQYRFEILEERVRRQLGELRDARAAGRAVATRKIKAFLREQEAFLAHMRAEMVDDEDVVRGSVDDSHLLSRETAEQNRRLGWKAQAQEKKRARVV